MEEFKYNEHGVCTNPHVIQRRVNEPYYFSFTIKTAMTDKGLWIFGCSLGLRNASGFGRPCSPKFCKMHFAREQDAVQAAYLTIKQEMMKRRTGASGTGADKEVPLWNAQILGMVEDAVKSAITGKSTESGMRSLFEGQELE